jgi:hypothetical protein
LKTEAPFCAVELGRGETEIDQQAVDRPLFRDNLGEMAEVLADKTETVRTGFAGKFFRLSLGVRVHIEGDHAGSPF